MDITSAAESWKPVLGYEGFYEVSDQGRVRSLDRVISAPGRWGQRLIRYSGRVLAPRLDPGGRLRVQLSRDGVQEDRKVHRLVMRAFIGECPEGQEVCHGNGDSKDNRLINLRYDTHSANELDKLAHGTHAMARKTHCKHGHEFTPENTYAQTGGGRGCRACKRESVQKYEAAKRLMKGQP